MGTSMVHKIFTGDFFVKKIIKDFPSKLRRDFLIKKFYTGIPFKMNLDQKKDRKKERKKERKPQLVLHVLCWNFTRASLARAVLLSKIRQVSGTRFLQGIS